MLRLVPFALLVLGCSDGEPALVAGAGDAAADPGGAEPGPPLDHRARCDAEPILGDYAAPGCGYDVPRPDQVLDVRPSCGEVVAEDRPRGLHLTFPHEDPSRYVAVSWFTSAKSRMTEVRIGTDPEALDDVRRGHSFTYRGLEGRVVHEVHLCGLTPGTTYYYQAGGEGGWSDVGSFATAPAEPDASFTFAVIGDTRSLDQSMWHDALEQVAAQGVDFLLFAGDAVDIGLLQSQWDVWFDAGQPYLASLPIIPANGNHDTIGVHWLAQFAFPRNEVSFGYRYGNTAVVAMTDAFVQANDPVWGRSVDFLDEAFGSNADARWRVLVNHRAFYSASLHGRSADLVADWLPVVDRHAVDLVFNGHDHNYERSKPLRGDRVVEAGEGTVYVVSSGVGAPLYDNGIDWWTETSSKVSTFCVVSVTVEAIEVVAYRMDGSVLDRFELTKGR